MPGPMRPGIVAGCGALWASSRTRKPLPYVATREGLGAPDRAGASQGWPRRVQHGAVRLTLPCDPRSKKVRSRMGERLTRSSGAAAAQRRVTRLRWRGAPEGEVASEPVRAPLEVDRAVQLRADHPLDQLQAGPRGGCP